MLVTVEMGKSQPGLLKSGDLCSDLSLDFIPANSPENCAFEKLALCAGESSCFIDERRQRLAPQHRAFFH